MNRATRRVSARLLGLVFLVGLVLAWAPRLRARRQAELTTR